jgi:hypothetical protein
LFGSIGPNSTGPKLWGDVSIAFTCGFANKVFIVDISTSLEAV